MRRGHLIGLVGNAGNSVGPYLHFHVGDANSLNGSEGVPYVLDAFEVGGHWPQIYKPAPSKFDARSHRLELALKDRVLSFPK